MVEMLGDKSEEKIISYHETEPTVCPFTKPSGRNLGNVLITLMCFIIPFMVRLY